MVIATAVNVVFRHILCKLNFSEINAKKPKVCNVRSISNRKKLRNFLCICITKVA